MPITEIAVAPSRANDSAAGMIFGMAASYPWLAMVNRRVRCFSLPASSPPA